MSEIIRGLASGKKMSRRDFLRGIGGAMASSVLKKLPEAPPAPSGLPPIDIDSIESSTFEYASPQMVAGTRLAGGAQIYKHGGFPGVYMDWPDTENMNASELNSLLAMGEAAKQRTFGADNPMLRYIYNPNIMEWLPEASVDDKTIRLLAPGSGVPGHIAERTYLSRDPGVEQINDHYNKFDEGNIKHIRNVRAREEQSRLRDEREQARARPDSVPGGRYSTPPSMQSEANAMGGMQGTPGEDHKETVGRIRRLLGVAAPVMAAGAASQQEQQK